MAQDRSLVDIVDIDSVNFVQAIVHDGIQPPDACLRARFRLLYDRAVLGWFSPSVACLIARLLLWYSLALSYSPLL